MPPPGRSPPPSTAPATSPCCSTSSAATARAAAIGSAAASARSRSRRPSLNRISAPIDDGSLVHTAQQGDRRALEQLLHLHHDRIHAVCRRITGNDADA